MFFVCVLHVRETVFIFCEFCGTFGKIYRYNNVVLYCTRYDFFFVCFVCFLFFKI